MAIRVGVNLHRGFSENLGSTESGSESTRTVNLGSTKSVSENLGSTESGSGRTRTVNLGSTKSGRTSGDQARGPDMSESGRANSIQPRRDTF